MIYQFDYNLIGSYDKETGELQRYTVTNPDGENSATYLATQNGDYIFTVEIEGKEYSKTVNVNNINGSQESEKDYKIEQDRYIIKLKDVENNNYTTFSEAYLLNNGELINVTNKIGDEDEDGIADIYALDLAETIGLEYRDGEVTRTIILNKDGIWYASEIKIRNYG